MTRRRRLFCATLMLALAIPVASYGSEAPASCPVTRPPDPAFIPPAPYPSVPPDNFGFWHGTSGLWTRLYPDGVLRGMKSRSPDRPNQFSTREKVFWWSPGFHPVGTPSPPLIVKGRRLDGDAPPLAQPWVTNAHAPEFGGWTMLIMLELPTIGCWEVTGSYGADEVTFVVWVEPPPA